MTLIILLAFISISYTIDNEFKILKNQNANPIVAETYSNLTLKLNKPAEMICIASCISNQECVSVVYDRKNILIQNCFLYNRYFNSSERIPSSTSNLYEKKQTTFSSVTGTIETSITVSSVTSTSETTTFLLPLSSTDTTTFTTSVTTVSSEAAITTKTTTLLSPSISTTYISSTTVLDSTVSSIFQNSNVSFLSIFSNPIDSLLFNNNPTIQGCSNIETATVNSIEYNIVSDLNVGVHLYDSNWNFQSTFNMVSINYVILANGYFYITDAGSGCRIIKTTLTSPTVLNSYGNGYRGLHYDLIGSRIIAAGCDVSSVDVFDLDLNLLSSVSIGDCPHGVTVYNSKIYVSLNNNGNVAVISNGVIENTLLTLCSSGLYRLSVDSFGYFALSCYGDGQVLSINNGKYY